MSSTAEKRLSGDPSLILTNAPAANVAAVVTFPAVVGFKNSVITFSLSASGITPAVARATLVFTQGGVVKTLGFQMPAAQLGPMQFSFTSHPIEGDENTSIVLTLPAMGASQTGEAWMTGYLSAA